MEPEPQIPISKEVAENIRRKQGRPRTAKKAYCVRRKAHVYQALIKVAAQEGFRHLGDWFESLTEKQPDDIEND